MTPHRSVASTAEEDPPSQGHPDLPWTGFSTVAVGLLVTHH
jgi:hypothetical protein